MDHEMVAESKETQDVRTKRCRICGEEKAVTCFEANHRMKDGYINTCKLCRTQQAAKRKQLKNTSKPPAPVPALKTKKTNPIGTAETPPAKASDATVVRLDFSKYMGIYAALETRAVAEFRDVGNQAMFILATHLDKQGQQGRASND